MRHGYIQLNDGHFWRALWSGATLNKTEAKVYSEAEYKTLMAENGYDPIFLKFVPLSFRYLPDGTELRSINNHSTSDRRILRNDNICYLSGRVAWGNASHDSEDVIWHHYEFVKFPEPTTATTANLKITGLPLTASTFTTTVGASKPTELGMPEDSAGRKGIPFTTGLIDYFPDACAAVARLSRKANEKHNPGEPLHWSKEKSKDHADCIGRHLAQRGTVDPEFNEYHDVALAWRAMANLQTLIETKQDAAKRVVEKVQAAEKPSRWHLRSAKSGHLWTTTGKYTRAQLVGLALDNEVLGRKDDE